MIDKTEDIKQFLKENFKPSLVTDTEEELQLSSSEVLQMLFSVFPTDCIDTFDLHNILTSLGYTPQKKGSTTFVWCFTSI